MINRDCLLAVCSLLLACLQELGMKCDWRQLMLLLRENHSAKLPSKQWSPCSLLWSQKNFPSNDRKSAVVPFSPRNSAYFFLTAHFILNTVQCFSCLLFLKPCFAPHRHEITSGCFALWLLKQPAQYRSNILLVSQMLRTWISCSMTAVIAKKKKKKVPLHPFSHGWRERQKHSQYLYPYKSSRKNSQKSYKKWWNGKQEMSKAFWSLCHLFHCSPLWCVNAQKDNALCNKLFNDPILYVMNVKNCETFQRCKAIEQSQKSQQYKTLFYSLGSTVQILKRMQNYRRSQHAFASRLDTFCIFLSSVILIDSVPVAFKEHLK